MLLYGIDKRVIDQVHITMKNNDQFISILRFPVTLGRLDQATRIKKISQHRHRQSFKHHVSCYTSLTISSSI
jgi:hypothetical protein